MKSLDTLLETAGWIFGFHMQMPRERNKEKFCPLKEKAYFHEVEHSLLVRNLRRPWHGWLEALSLSVLSIKGLGEILVRVSIAVMKDCDHRQVGEARVYLLYPHHHCPSLKEVRMGTQTGQEADGAGHGGVMLTGMFATSCSASFLMGPRTSSTPHNGLGPPH